MNKDQIIMGLATGLLGIGLFISHNATAEDTVTLTQREYLLLRKDIENQQELIVREREAADYWASMFIYTQMCARLAVQAGTPVLICYGDGEL